MTSSSLGPLLAKWDRAPGDPAMTEFKRQARAHQAAWRAERGLGYGEFPVGIPNGSVLTVDDGLAYANFLSNKIRKAVDHRCDPARKQRWQTFDQTRLRNNLLSSMPMCFNLFGELHDDPARIGAAGRRWWSVDEPGDRVEFEWSPGRLDPAFTGDRTAFDVALFFGSPQNGQTVIGVETKYHEHAVRERAPDPIQRLPRYREITETATRQHGVFRSDWEHLVVGTPLQQIWRDHLLLLSMLQHPSKQWSGGRYVLVYPAGNTSYANLAGAYVEVLNDASTFGYATIEDLLEAQLLHDADTEVSFRKRYLW